MKERYPENSSQQDETIDFCPGIQSFKTTSESVYKKMSDGHFWCQSEKENKVSDFILFINENLGESLEVYLKEKSNFGIILVQSKNGETAPIRNEKDVLDPNKIEIGVFEIFKNENNAYSVGECIDIVSATLVPYKGAKIFKTNLLKQNIPFTYDSHFWDTVLDIS